MTGPSGGSVRDPFTLGPLPSGRLLRTVDQRVVRAPLARIFALAADVERWPRHLSHYRWVRMDERARDGGGIVAMSANRPFGPVGWPTFWTSEMAVAAPGGGHPDGPWIRFRHIRGVTSRMDVEWTFREVGEGTHVSIIHVWDGPGWPLIGRFAATRVIGPVFVHGIASRTLAGLARVAERDARTPS
jgi:hypothetical protein